MSKEQEMGEENTETIYGINGATPIEIRAIPTPEPEIIDNYLSLMSKEIARYSIGSVDKVAHSLRSSNLNTNQKISETLSKIQPDDPHFAKLDLSTEQGMFDAASLTIAKAKTLQAEVSDPKVKSQIQQFSDVIIDRAVDFINSVGQSKTLRILAGLGLVAEATGCALPPQTPDATAFPTAIASPTENPTAAPTATEQPRTPTPEKSNISKVSPKIEAASKEKLASYQGGFNVPGYTLVGEQSITAPGATPIEIGLMTSRNGAEAYALKIVNKWQVLSLLSNIPNKQGELYNEYGYWDKSSFLPVLAVKIDATGIPTGDNYVWGDGKSYPLEKSGESENLFKNDVLALIDTGNKFMAERKSADGKGIDYVYSWTPDGNLVILDSATNKVFAKLTESGKWQIEIVRDLAYWQKIISGDCSNPENGFVFSCDFVWQVNDVLDSTEIKTKQGPFTILGQDGVITRGASQAEAETAVTNGDTVLAVKDKPQYNKKYIAAADAWSTTGDTIFEASYLQQKNGDTNIQIEFGQYEGPKAPSVYIDSFELFYLIRYASMFKQMPKYMVVIKDYVNYVTPDSLGLTPQDWIQQLDALKTSGKVKDIMVMVYSSPKHMIFTQ